MAYTQNAVQAQSFCKSLNLQDYFNGALGDAFEYNLNTGRVKAKIIGPGTLMER